MGNQLLLEIKPGQGLDSGVFPTAQPTSGPIWKASENAWFRPLSLTHTLGRARAVRSIGRRAQAMAQAYVNGETRLYYEDLGIINYWNGSGIGTIIGELDDAGSYDLEPYGTWLLATDNIDQPQIWKNDFPNTFIDFGVGEFTRARIIKKLAQRAIVYNTDALPSGMHYSKPSDPEIWDPVIAGVITGAGNLPFRNLDSAIVAVADLGGAHAVYTEDKMLLVEYLGEALRFGAPRQPLAGIGAVSRESVISQGGSNWGIFPGGIFVTDGSSFKILDDPAISEWLRDMVDWSRGEEVSGYWDRILKCFVWSVPLYGGNSQGIMMDLQGRFSYFDSDFVSSIEQEVFSSPFVGLSDGIYRVSLPSTVLGTMELQTHLLDGGTRQKYKAWDMGLFQGTLSGQVRFGFSDDGESTSWHDWMDLAQRVPFAPVESVFIAMQFSSEAAFDLNSIQLYGAYGGLVT